MKKQSAALWLFVLLVSLGLIFVLLVSRREPAAPLPTETVVLPSETPRSLAAAPARIQATVALPPTATPLIFPAVPTMAEPVSVTLAAPEVLNPPLLNSYRVTIPQPAPPGFMLANLCPGFGTPISLLIYDWDTGVSTSLSDAEIAQIPLGWDASGSIWQGYESPHPFNQPDDAHLRWKLDLYLPDGTDRWIDIYSSATTPDSYYTYAFTITAPYAVNGLHLGNHPCTAFKSPAAQITAFFDAVSQFQNIVPYPPFISGTDPRWKRGVAKPVAAYADLRSVPSKANNNPIGSIDTSVPLFFALDPSWDGWAQVKLGSVQAWVDTQSVDLTPDG